MVRRIEHAIGAVLAGGASRRMGSDKALLLYEGRPLIEHVLDALDEVFAETVIVGRPPGWLKRTRVHCIPDEHPGQGPLAGLLTALRYAAGRSVFLCGCDMPLLKPGAIRLVLHSLGDASAAMPLVGGRLQPLHAAYSSRCLPIVAGLLQTDDRSMHRLAASVPTVVIAEAEFALADPTLQSVRSLNRPSDLSEPTPPSRNESGR